MTKLELPLDKVIIGDCVKVLDKFPERTVDLIFADPPYNLQLQNDLWRPNMTKVDPVDETWDQFDSFGDYDQFTRDWLVACRRVLKDTGTLWVIGSYHNIHRVGTILLDLDYWILNEIVWIKSNPTPNFKGTRFANAHETLIWAQKEKGGRYTFNYRQMKKHNSNKQMRSDWRFPIVSGTERLVDSNGEKAHPTQKPEALLERILQSSSNPGDVVVDPFFGTGTTGAVAKRLRRHWIGIERDEEYVKVARKRISAIVPQTNEQLVLNEKRHDIRIPFGALLERGLIQPGQTLTFGKKGEQSAVVLANGHLRWNGQEGSIHAIGRLITGSPCNGWEHWHTTNDAGQRVAIDFFRAQIRREAPI